MDDRRLHAHLIGQQGSRRALNTPVLVIDADALARNIATMATFAAENGIRLRPHAKTHKSADIARMQIAAGAAGVCCAKIGEAEALAEAGGVESILITSPVVSPQAIARLAVLNTQIADLAVVADNPANVAMIAEAIGEKPLTVFVDIDPGIRRTGVASAADAVALAQAIRAAPTLLFGGVQFYCGSQQHIETFAERRDAIAERTSYLQSVLDALRDAGAPAPIVTGGGTGTHRIDAALCVLTELQVGSYVFMDRQYNDCDLTGQGAAPYETALMIDARVISANAKALVTIDAGFKAMATDGGQPAILSGAPDGAAFAFMGDEHGAIVAKDSGLKLGDIVTLASPHCDPTVNLYDYFHVVRGDTLVDIWRVTARGASR